MSRERGGRERGGEGERERGTRTGRHTDTETDSRTDDRDRQTDREPSTSMRSHYMGETLVCANCSAVAVSLRALDPKHISVIWYIRTSHKKIRLIPST